MRDDRELEGGSGPGDPGLDPNEPLPLMEIADSFRARMAVELLRAEGIPCYLHGADSGVGVFGVGHYPDWSAQPPPTLMVPRCELERARQLLREAWGE